MVAGRLCDACQNDEEIEIRVAVGVDDVARVAPHRFEALRHLTNGSLIPEDVFHVDHVKKSLIHWGS